MDTPRNPPRILAVDYGTRRIGLAITDPTGVMALPLPVIAIPSDGLARMNRGAIPSNRGRPPTPDIGAEACERSTVVQRIRTLVREKKVDRIIVGLPLNTDDTAGPRAKEAEVFARELEAALGIPVETYDERYTTRQAEAMLAGVPLSRKRKRSHLNSVAAQVLLESYLHAMRQHTDKISN